MSTHSPGSCLVGSGRDSLYHVHSHLVHGFLSWRRQYRHSMSASKLIFSNCSSSCERSMGCPTSLSRMTWQSFVRFVTVYSSCVLDALWKWATLTKYCFPRVHSTRKI